MAPPPQDPFIYDRQGSGVPQGTGEQVRDKGFPVYVRTDDGQFHPVLQGANGAYYENGGKQLPLYNPDDPSLGPKFYRYQGDDPNQSGNQPYYEEADSHRILDTIDKSVSGKDGAAQWTPDRITSDAVAKTVDPRTLTSPGTDGTNSLGNISKPGSFTGAVASASSAKLAEIHDEMTRINSDVHSTLLDAALLKARSKDYDVRYTYLNWLITDTKARMNQLPIGDSDKRAQAQAYIDYQQKQLDNARSLFTAYLSQLTGASNAANKPKTGEQRVGRQEAPPPVGAPQTQTSPQGAPQGGGVSASGGGGSTSGGDVPGTTTTGADPTAQTTTPGTTKKGLDADDILSKLQQNGQPVGTAGQQPTVMPTTATPTVNPTAQRGGQPMTTGMPVSYTGSPTSTTGAGQPMSDDAFNNLLSQIKSRSNNASTPSEDIPTVTTSTDSPTPVPAGAVPTAQPASVPNLSTANTRTTSTTPGAGAPSGGDGNNNRPTTSGMPMMPMAPMMGNPGGQGGRKNAGGESSVKSEQDLGSRLGGPVATTTPVVNDKKNKNVLPDDDDAPATGTRT